MKAYRIHLHVWVEVKDFHFNRWRDKVPRRVFTLGIEILKVAARTSITGTILALSCGTEDHYGRGSCFPLCLSDFGRRDRTILHRGYATDFQGHLYEK